MNVSLFHVCNLTLSGFEYKYFDHNDMFSRFDCFGFCLIEHFDVIICKFKVMLFVYLVSLNAFQAKKRKLGLVVDEDEDTKTEEGYGEGQSGDDLTRLVNV